MHPLQAHESISDSRLKSLATATRRHRALGAALRLAIFFVFALCAAPASFVHTHDGPLSKTIDLSHKIDADGATMLKEGWTVVRRKIISPTDFINNTCDLGGHEPAAKTVSLSNVWGPSFTTQISSGHGVATYCLCEAATQGTLAGAASGHCKIHICGLCHTVTRWP